MQSRLCGWLVVAAWCVAGCGTKDAAPGKSGGESVRLEFGDCDQQTVAFESGPIPLFRGHGIGPDAPVVGSPTGSGHKHNGVLVPAWGEGGPRAVLKVGMTPATVTGALDKIAVRKLLAPERPKLQACYEQALSSKPTLRGMVKATFQIAANGTVVSATASGLDPDVANCMVGVLKAIAFPKHDGNVEVTDTFTFAGSPLAPAPSDAVKEAPFNDLGPPSPSMDPEEQYKPGDLNPLTAQRKELVACLANQTPAYGVIVVDLTYTAAREVSQATAHGDGSEATLRCVADAARAMKLTTVVKPRERCALAYGVIRTLSEAPGVDIGDTIALQGKPIVKTAAVAAASGDALSISELAIAASQPATAPVSVRGPLVLRAVDATPMKVISRVIGTLIAAHRDVVLARQHDKDWVLVNPDQLPAMPAIPVPVGTGRPRGLVVQLPGEHPSRVILSLLVTGKDVALGLSELDETKRVSFDQLAAALKTQKTSTFFADRNDIEIAGDDTATYGQMVRTIDEVQRAGFVSWQLIRPAQLSSQPDDYAVQ